MTNPSCSTCPPGPLYELAIICSFICVCNAKPLEGKTGSALKQGCVDTGLDWMRESGQATNIHPEVGYYMGPPGANMTPIPLLKNNTAVPEGIRNHWHRFNRVVKINKENGIEKYTKGQLRIPDVVITNEPGQEPTQQNIKQVVEIKFPPDTWGKGQEEDYKKIAGKGSNGKAKLTELSPDKCGCGDKKQPKTDPVAVPHRELEDAWDKQRDSLDTSPWTDTGIIVGGTILLIGLILDDLIPVGATQADDVLIPPTTMAIGNSAVRLVAAFSSAVAVPVLAP